MPTLPIPTTSDGTHTDWAVNGIADGWEAVLKGSPDSTFVSSAANGQESTFNCGVGWRPTPGRIMALTVHYRMRQTGAVGATIEMYITQGGTDRSAGNVVIAPAQTDWLEGVVRVREDWTTTQRFSLTDVDALGVGVHMVAAPASGQIEVSQLWVEVEYIDTFYVYDPFDGVLPDAVTGPLQWSTSGTQPVAITGANYLEINDTSAADFRTYLYRELNGVKGFNSSFIVEMETRVIVTDLSAAPSVSLAYLLDMSDDYTWFTVIAAKFNGVYHLCVNGALTPLPTSPADCIASAPFDFNGKDTHVRIRVDRDVYPDTYGKTQLFVDYATTPLLEVDTADLPPNVATFPRSIMGTTDVGECDLALDYISWKAYKKRGDVFSGWASYDFSTNEIHEDSADTDVAQLQTIDPPGVTVGQSNYACRFDVNDSNELCRLYQVLTLKAATNYKIDIDHKMDIGGVDGELVIQRLPDLYFWDETGSNWSATPDSVDLTNTITRDRVAVMTGINLAAAGQVVVSVQAKITAAAVHKIWIYKVYLVEE